MGASLVASSWGLSWGNSWGLSWGTGSAPTPTPAGSYGDVRKKRWTVRHEGKTYYFSSAEKAAEFLELHEVPETKPLQRKPSIVIEYRGVDISTQTVEQIDGVELLRQAKKKELRQMMARISAQIAAETAMDDDLLIMLLS